MVSTLLLKGVGDEGDRFPAAAVSGKAHDKAQGIILIFHKTLVFQAFYTQHTLRFAKPPLCERSVLHGFFNGAMRHCL